MRPGVSPTYSANQRCQSSVLGYTEVTTIAGGKMRRLSKWVSIGLFATAAAVGPLALPSAASAAVSTPAAAVATPSPGTGFGYGTDSASMTVTGSNPYKEPVIGSNYGGYMGMAGNWA